MHYLLKISDQTKSKIKECGFLKEQDAYFSTVLNVGSRDVVFQIKIFPRKKCYSEMVFSFYSLQEQKGAFDFPWPIHSYTPGLLSP